jgi:hypothetical protein
LGGKRIKREREREREREEGKGLRIDNKINSSSTYDGKSE